MINSLYICGRIVRLDHRMTREPNALPSFLVRLLNSSTMHKSIKNLVFPGQRFGRLTVLHETKVLTNKGYNTRAIVCVCDCGTIKTILIGNLLRRVRSCGCLMNELVVSRSITHGESYSHIYKVLERMKSRCYYKNNIGYKNYGGRGISICDEWLNNPASFFEWAYKNGYDRNLTIERKDYNKGYSPENCEFADRITQANNSRNNRIIEYNGNKLTMANFCRKHNLSYSRFSDRLYHGKSIEEAMINCNPFSESLYHKLS